jgi:hypothetical protein
VRAIVPSFYGSANAPASAQRLRTARPASFQLLIDKERDAERNRLGGGPGTATTL